MKLPPVYHPSHGPQVWPWWRLLAVGIVRCTHDPYFFFWMTPISYNIWVYTRRGALCFNYRVRKHVYDSFAQSECRDVGTNNYLLGGEWVRRD